jgi:hypothetical protein
MHQSIIPTSFQDETGLPKILFTLLMLSLLHTSGYPLAYGEDISASGLRDKELSASGLRSKDTGYPPQG